MTSRRLIDLFAIANASASIARKHLLIRSNQLNVYAATSSIGKTRLQHYPITTATAQKKDISQDYHCDPGAGSTANPKPQDDLGMHQETIGTKPLPDGTILVKQDYHYHPQPKDDLKKKAGVAYGTRTPPPPPVEAKRLQHAYEASIPLEPADPPAKQTHRSVVGLHAEALTEGVNDEVFYLKHESTSSVMAKKPHATEGAQSSTGDGINAPEFCWEIPGWRKEEEAIAALGKQAFQSWRARGLFGGTAASVRPVPGAVPLKGDTEPEPKPDVKVMQDSKLTELLLTHKLKVDRKEIETLAVDISKYVQKSVDVPVCVRTVFPHFQQAGETPYGMTASRVPSSRMGRLLHYGGLAAGMAWGAANESVRRVAVGTGDAATSVMFNEANIKRLVKKLSRMRGAALKLGQMMSFQDKMLPAPIQEVLTRVQDSADYMPASQRDKVLAANLGSNWRDLFSEFSEVPMAAASIGQVHAAKLASNGVPVAVKIQYPGVATSISSDLNNLAVLLTTSKLLPKGLYLDKTIANARIELGWECDYVREAESAKRFAKILEHESDVFRVPQIFDEACGPQVLTMEFMKGIAVTKMVKNLTQEERNFIGTQILGLCLREVARYKFMQTDPNWTNFLWNAADKKIELLDFGASREFSDDFITLYTAVLKAAANHDLDACRKLSIKLGYLTGLESEAMTRAHITSILTLAEPFSVNAPAVYDFNDQTVTERVKAQIPLMLRERLVPPPEETYSLHRKLSGAFLLCARLQSRVPCRRIFLEALGV